MVNYFQLALIVLAVSLVVGDLSFLYGRYVGIRDDLDDAYSTGWLDCEEAVSRKMEAIYQDKGEVAKLKSDLWLP